MLDGRKIMLGVTGGIAAYKAVEVASRLRKLGAEVAVVMTRNATRLVSPLTFRTITGHPVYTEMFEEPRRWNVEHVELAQWAELVVVAPATANLLGKVAAGIADDFLTTAIVAADCPCLLVPAMNHRMYANPVVQRNIRLLRALGYEIMEPEHGRLASGAVGKGRLPEPDRIVRRVVQMLTRREDMVGVRVLITAGPTREPLDPVRYLSNRSSGRMGYALAETARARGAEVVLISGPTALAAPEGVQLVRVVTAEEMRRAVLDHLAWARVVVAAAAVADWRPVEVAKQKLKKEQGPLTIQLVPTVDILAEVSQRRRPGQLVVGFAAETEDVLANARAKLERKGLDLMVANNVGRPDVGFDSEFNEVWLLDPGGGCLHVPRCRKEEVADRIWDRVVELLANATPSGG